MNITVTGAAGFIGSHLADRLAQQGHTVTGIDTLLTGRRDNVGDWQFRHADITVGPDIVADADPDLIVHCAASYHEPTKWHRDTETNVKGAINVAIAARSLAARVVYFQTALIYGQHPLVSISTQFNTTTIDGTPPLSVRTPANPENSYAISKYAAEQYLRHAEVPLLVFRLANIYGPRNLSGPIPTFYKKILAGERCQVAPTRRDFVYINDLVALVDQAIAENATGTYHVSTGTDIPIGQVYDAVLDAMDAYGHPEPEQLPPNLEDAPTILLDPSQTQRDFTWIATTDLDEGVEAAVEWYREHGVEQTFTHLAKT